MAAGLLSLIGGARRALTGSARASELFPQTRPDVDGEACKHDCDSCTVKYPRHFKVEESHPLYGNIKPWSTHVIVATSKSDWKRDVEDERGSVMEAFGHASKPGNGVGFFLDSLVFPVTFILRIGVYMSILTCNLASHALRL